MKKTIENLNVKNKKVIIRCDLNVPMKNGVITDDTRIVASLKTIKYVLNQNGSVIILSHLGKIKTESDKQTNSLEPISRRLSQLLNQPVKFSKDTRSENLTQMAQELQPQEVLLIENTRFEDIPDKKESGCDQELASYWASLGEIFINDAYGTCHRAHASNVGISKYLPSGIGFLVQEEITKLDQIMNEDTHPFIVVMGGAKVKDKIKMISNLIEKCDKLLIGGAMAYTFFKAMGYPTGISITDDESLEFCQKIINQYKDKIILPKDCLCATSTNTPEFQIKSISEIQTTEMGLDIGPETIQIFQNILKEAKRVIINGPMGLFENPKYQKGTKSLYDCLIENKVKTLVGGGDSAASVNLLSDANQFYHISTGGGATLEYLEGNGLPAISAIEDE